MTNNRTENRMCQFIHDLTFEQLPQHVIDYSKRLLLDLVGVMYLSYKAESTEPIFHSIRKLAGSGKGTIVGSAIKVPPQYAALFNGVLAHSSEFDDTNALGHSHPGAVIIPAVLAAAEQKENVTGKDFITAIVVGYEIMCRVGASLGKSVHKRGFHVTPICGIFGAVAAIAKLYKLDERTIHSAMGLAGSLVAGSHQFSENGAWNKRLHPGFMAHNAMLSVQLAADGIPGATLPLTGARGFLQGYTDDPNPDVLERDLGVFWYLDKTAIKPYPACRLTHSAIDLIINFVKENEVNIEEIEHIYIEISPRAFLATGERVPNKLNPTNTVDAQFSIYYQVAVALLTGEINTESYRLIGSSLIPMLTRKIKVQQNDSFEKLETRIKIVSAKEERIMSLKIPKGEPQNPVSWEEVVTKFISLSVRFGERKQRELFQFIKVIDTVNDLRPFYSMLSGSKD